jgi:hypothetical protein
MHANDYQNLIEGDCSCSGLHERDFKKRLQFARDNGCNTVILTGIGEPTANLVFLERFAGWNEDIPSPFKWIDLQTSGVFLGTDNLRFLREEVGVSTISLSLSDIFTDGDNAAINGTPEKLKFCIKEKCHQIRECGFNLRLALNMHSAYNLITPACLFNRAAELEANQITFKRLDFSATPATPQDEWVINHRFTHFNELKDYIEVNGRPLEVMPYGTTRYSVHGISTVVDGDCMSRQVKEVIKYLILRPDCRLYTKWDDKGSLLF